MGIPIHFYTWLLRVAHRGLDRSLGVRHPADTVWWYNQETRRLAVGSAAHIEALAFTEKMSRG